MSKNRRVEIQRAITEIENPYPKDNLISSYADFLKVRDYLSHYQFNPVVFGKLLDLAIDEWNTDKRISRLSLLLKIKQYFYISQLETVRGYYIRNTKANFILSAETRNKMFVLFRKTFEESEYLRDKQLDEARKFCNYILINLELTSAEEAWLCANSTNSQLILNRVLRYPAKSEVISIWAKNNLLNDDYRARRAELLSWIINQEPNFEIDYQTLINDFEYLNQCDFQAIQNYNDETYANEVLERELREYLPTKIHYGYLDNTAYEERVDLSIPELNISKRPYKVPIDLSNFPISIPNFEALRQDFLTNLPTHQKLTMIWAIGYSRIGNDVKYSLLKKYYNIHTHFSMYKVCIRTKNIELLKWILEQL